MNYRRSLHIPFYVSFAINGEKVTVERRVAIEGKSAKEEREIERESGEDWAATFLHGLGEEAPPRVITRTSGTVSVQLSRQSRVHPIAPAAIRSRSSQPDN